MIPAVALSAWQIAKELAISLKYYMEVRAKNVELNNVYKSHDREKDIHNEIMVTLDKKDLARRSSDTIRMGFYDKSVEALKRRLRIQQNISQSLENKLNV